MRKEVKLGDICNILNGYAFKSKEYVEDGIRVIRITNVQKGNIEDNDPKYYDISKIEELKNYMLKENDLLISLTGNVGRVGLLPKKLLPAGLNQRVGCLRIKDERNVSVEYLYQYFNSYNFERDCINNSKGIAQKNLSTEWLKNYKVSIPNLNEQNRIVNELKKIQRLKKLKEQQLKELNQLIKSQFVEMFGDPIINEKNWNVDTIKNVAPRTKYVGKFDAKVWILNLDMIESGTGNIIEYMYEDLEKIKSSTCTFNEEYVLYSKLRPYLNKVVVPIRKGYATSEMIPLKPDITRVEKQFLAYLLRSEQFVNYISLKTIGAKMPRVSMEIFMKFNLILPPLSLQNQFSEIVKQIDKQKFEIEKSLKETQELYESLMEKYFG